MTILGRAKKSSVASLPAEPAQKPGPGRPGKDGDKVTLYEAFDHMYLCERTRCQVYGALEDVLYVTADLLWKPTGELIRFVSALTRRGPIVLMCRDLARYPVTAIELYCPRVRVETMLAMRKHLLGAFGDHFWPQRLPRHARQPKKNQRLKQPSNDSLQQVPRGWEGYERFAMLSAIALGLLPLIALKFSPEVWGRFNAFLRTCSRPIPSERTVKDVVAQMGLEDFLSVAPRATMQEIRDQLLADEEAAQDHRLSPEQEAA